MIGLAVGIAIIGILVFIRVFRQTRAGLRLRSTLSQLKLSEIIALAFVYLVLFLVTSGIAFAWVVLQVENAQIMAGVREPRERSENASLSDRPPPNPNVSIPTFPEVTLPTFPNVTFPTFPTITGPDDRESGG